MSDTFESLRPLMFGIAYRMLGSAADAEDIVQEAYLRYQSAEQVLALKAFLTRVVTRLCLDHLKSARVQRESYIGTWLPEPLPTDPQTEPEALAALNESLSMAFLALLETLSPLERAVLVLRDVFDYDHAEVAAVVGKSEAACRQALHRAREAIRKGKPRFDSPPEATRTLFGQFMAACMQGDLAGLESLLAADVTVYSDGGGRAKAATRPVIGVRAVSAFVLGLARRIPADAQIIPVTVNSQPGLLVRQNNQVLVVLTVDAAQGKLTALRLISNPDKLRRWQHYPGSG
jgi:RNA polymerase sigma-70 factor (ECF subfamily)